MASETRAAFSGVQMPTEQSHHRHSLAGPDHCAGAGRSWIPAIVMRPAAGDHALVVVSVRMSGRGAIPGLPAAQTDNSCCSARAAEGGSGAVVGTGGVPAWWWGGSPQIGQGQAWKPTSARWLPGATGESMSADVHAAAGCLGFHSSVQPPACPPLVPSQQEKKTPVRFGTAPCFFRVSREHLRLENPAVGCLRIPFAWHCWQRGKPGRCEARWMLCHRLDRLAPAAGQLREPRSFTVVADRVAMSADYLN